MRARGAGGVVVDFLEYRIQQLASGSAKPQAFVQGYVLARGVGDLISREVDQLIDRGNVLLARWGRR